MRNETDCRNIGLLRGRRDRRHHVAVLVDRRVGEPELPQLGGEIAEQHQLFPVLGNVVELSSDCVS